ncbi:MAG: hypothetical protein AAB113_05690 [Candidatus Eisenbacteria bacterium]
MNQAWRDHIDALRRFNEWEAEQLRNRPPEYSRALAWLSEAWEFAARYGPAQDPRAHRDQHLRDILQIRRAFERARISP